MSVVTEACTFSGVDKVLTDAEEAERLFVAVTQSYERELVRTIADGGLRSRRRVLDARMG